MATWTSPATIKAAITNGKPLTGTGGNGDQIADDLQYLRDRVDAIGIGSSAGLHDDFTQDSFHITSGGITDIEPYAWELGGATLPAIGGAPDHWAVLSNGGANHAVMAASTYKMRFDLDRDHTLYFECRHKNTIADSTNVWMIGFQDASLAVSASTCVTTQSDIIGFVQDAVAQKYDAVVSKAAASLVVANSVGLASAWSVLRIEVTFAGATKKVEFFIDGASVGSTTDTTKIPVVKMRPLIGFANGGGARLNYIDYVDADWTVRPLSA